VENDEDNNAARARLEAEQGRVEGLIEEFRAELGTSETEGSSELADYDQHPADSGSDTFEREKDLSILEQLENELAELHAALERVDAGTYGVDENTGEAIDPARLEALPAARTNVGEADTRVETREDEIPDTDLPGTSSSEDRS
jgi:RNA polymerase-binding transcription factor DksA